MGVDLTQMTKIPLLLLPGLLCDAEVWSYQCRELADITDIIIPDLSHAASPHDMVKSALISAPPQFALAGHSMGGWVALEIMKQCPERVLGLALLNTTALPDTKEKQDARLAMLAMFDSENNFPIIEKLLQLFVHNNAVVSSVKKMLERNLFAFANQEKAMIQREDCIASLDSINCPTLIIHSENDAVFQYEDSYFLATKIKHTTLVVIENCGHMSPMESPKQVTELMRIWLNSFTR